MFLVPIFFKTKKKGELKKKKRLRQLRVQRACRACRVLGCSTAEADNSSRYLSAFAVCCCDDAATPVYVRSCVCGVLSLYALFPFPRGEVRKANKYVVITTAVCVPRLVTWMRAHLLAGYLPVLETRFWDVGQTVETREFWVFQLCIINLFEVPNSGTVIILFLRKTRQAT